MKKIKKNRPLAVFLGVIIFVPSLVFCLSLAWFVGGVAFHLIPLVMMFNMVFTFIVVRQSLLYIISPYWDGYRL